MKHVVFMNYVADESFDVQSALVDNGYDYSQLLVGAQKQLLKQHGHKQKQHCAIVVDEPALAFLKQQFPTIRTAEFA